MLSAYELFNELISGRLSSVNVGFLFIPLGYGLLELRPRAYTWALIVMVLGWILFAILFAGLLFGSQFAIDDKVITGWKRWGVGITILAGCGALQWWVTWVLRRDDVEILFRKAA